MKLTCAAVAAVLMAPELIGQTPAFEVASIKLSKGVTNGTAVLQDPSGKLTTQNATLRMLVRFAFNVRDHQILGGPGWLDAERYDIVAKPESKSRNGEEFRQMVQGLLAERFSLKTHRETREMPVYALVAGKNGPRLSETTGPTAFCKYVSGLLTCQKVPMPYLASELARRLGREVVDRTGLTGEYDLKLEWTPDEFQVPGPGEVSARPPGDSVGPSLFQAIQERLGLKLEAAKGPVAVVVIDSAEKPVVEGAVPNR